MKNSTKKFWNIVYSLQLDDKKLKTMKVITAVTVLKRIHAHTRWYHNVVRMMQCYETHIDGQ